VNSSQYPASEAGALAAWEAALARGQFRIQQCRECGAFGLPPAASCRHCGAEALRWVEPSGRGVVHSTGLTLAPGADRAALPALVVIELEEGPRLPGRVMDVDAAELKPGLPVSAHVGLLGGKPAVLFYSKEQGDHEW
jgi:uncharacterized OB-fold protein